MKLTEENYVGIAEQAIKELCSEKDQKGRLVGPVTTSKIRNLLAMTSDIYNDVVNSQSDKLNAEIIGRINYTKYFVLKEKAVPEVLLKVVEAKRLLESGRVTSVQEAAEQVDISRSSFYKYKDDIFPFHDNAKGRTITMVIQLDDTPGLLSTVLNIVAEFHANILTIHQSIPVNGIASLTLSIDILPETGDLSQMVDKIEGQDGIHYLKILARE